jgi:hypothetical protein
MQNKQKKQLKIMQKSMKLKIGNQYRESEKLKVASLKRSVKLISF